MLADDVVVEVVGVDAVNSDDELLSRFLIFSGILKLNAIVYAPTEDDTLFLKYNKICVQVTVPSNRCEVRKYSN